MMEFNIKAIMILILYGLTVFVSIQAMREKITLKEWFFLCVIFVCGVLLLGRV